MKKGVTRVVFLVGDYAIKFPRVNKWKSFLRGLLANMSERMWYKTSPKEWKTKMCPSLFCLGGFILICKRARPITSSVFNRINFDEFNPLPLDKKVENFGLYKDRLVLIDYADSRYWCSDCEAIFKCKKSVK